MIDAEIGDLGPAAVGVRRPQPFQPGRVDSRRSDFSRKRGKETIRSEIRRTGDARGAGVPDARGFRHGVQRGEEKLTVGFDRRRGADRAHPATGERDQGQHQQSSGVMRAHGTAALV